jgi:hypothetical protein
MDSTEAKSYKVPILPAKPSEALQGKRITQEMIDSALAYDKTFRPSYVYLNEKDAHNRNVETLAQINRTFVENDHVVAEVIPNRKYKGEKFEDIAAADGTHPGRSVDLWNKKLIPGCKSEYYLEGIALCGAQKQAVVNLPSIYFSAEIDGATHNFSINTGPIASTGDDTMPENDQKVDFAAMQKQLDDQKQDLEKLQGEVKTLSTERDHYRTESENRTKEYKELKGQFDKQEVDKLLDSNDFRGKFKSDERATIVEMALSLKDDVVQFSSGKTRYEAYLESIKNRPVIIRLDSVAGNVPNQIHVEGQPESPTAAIHQFAAENKLNTLNVEDLEKAEDGAMRKWPAVFGIKEGVN